MGYMEAREELRQLRQRQRQALATPAPEELIEQIRHAFANTIIPEADSLVTCSCDECQGIKRRFQGKHWTEITDPRNFHMLDFSLSLLSAAAFRFYLPAFLLGDLQELGQDETKNLWGYDSYLTPPETEGEEAQSWFAEFGTTIMEYFLSKVSGFTAEQKEALKAYLRFSYRRRPAIDQITEVEHQRTLDFWDTFEG